MKVVGKVHKVLDLIKVSDKFKKRDLVIETGEKYPQLIAIETHNGNTDILNNLREGDVVECDINLRGREWKNPQGETKYFNSVCGSNRPVQPKESFIMFKLFAWLRKTNRLTDTMIEDIAAVIDKIGLNHEKGFIALFEHAKDCYGRYYENLNGWKMGIRYSEEHLCLTFLRAQFVKEGIDVPDYYAAVWPVADEDLL